MILSGKAIQKLIDSGILRVEPEVIINEASIKLHLSDLLGTYTLKPKEFIVTKTKERITMPKDYAGLYDGYTHLARKGVMTHMGSMFVQPGSDGQMTLEIFNASDTQVLLEPEMRVGQLIIIKVADK